MKPPSARELWALPELALVPALLAAIDGMLASLQAQHGTLHDDWQPGDPSTLREARAVVDELLRARRVLRRYARTVRLTLRDTEPNDHELPF
jgi:hypothetical protein